jgi:serine/threonine protein kinase
MPRCRSCSAEVPAASRFCNACGTEVEALSAGATRTTAPSYASVPSSFDQARFTAGTVLADRYRIVGMLGKGGMGEVYRAEDLKLGQPVALKFLPVAKEKDDSRLARLLNEVRLARQVSHPNVCRVYDVAEVDGLHFMAMEYVDGEDLASLLRRIGRLPHEKALEISRQICAGLAAAHEQGILHRDLKPANVMIDGRGRVKLADFGLANLDEGIKGEDARAGTPAYMAPEQLAGREVTMRSDIYALGLVLYEIFTGQMAFSGNSVAEIEKLHQHSVPTSPTQVVTEVDEMVEQVILRCLEKEPLARPASALAVAAALPGGDPLAAALAAGETPSPQMVADAGALGGLSPKIAITALLMVIIAIVLSVSNGQRNDLENKIPLNLPPDELAAQAVQKLTDLGVVEMGKHRRFGFERNRTYLSWLDDQEPKVDLAVLNTGRTAVASFWYRYSASELEPNDLHAFGVSMDDPVQGLPGQGRIWLDLEGRLRGLDLVPDRFIDAEREPIAWSFFFAAAGLDSASFVPTDPVRSPSTACDEIKAWRGPVYDGVEGVVQAGRVGGVPVYFATLGPWDLVASEQNSASGANWIMGLFLVLIVTTALVLARRNLQSGRSDTNGAVKVMVFFVLCIYATWIFTEVRLDTLAGGSLFRQLTFGRLVAHGLTHGVLIGLMYIALEPYVRRLWPETLVSWSRLLRGRLRDPLVGRDLLVGMAVVGFLSSVFVKLEGLLRDAQNMPTPMSQMGAGWGTGLLGIRYALSDLVTHLEGSLSAAMLFLIMLLIFRLLFRRNWAAIVAVHVLFTFSVGAAVVSESQGLWLTVLMVGSANLIVAVLIRLVLKFGLLSLASGLLMMSVMRAANLTWDFGLWYAGSGLVTMILVLALAVWAFLSSLGGRKLFGDSVLD